MKLSKALTLIAFLAILAMATHMSIDSDTWWHLRSGQWMVENRTLITEDTFSFTRAGTPWQYPGLWIEVVMFLLFDLFGPGGLNLGVSIIVGAIFIYVWLTMEGPPLIKVSVLLLAAASSAVYWAARPYLVTYLLAAIFFFILDRYSRKRKGKLWLLPVLMIIWVNSHGGFLAGFLIIAPFLVDALFDWISAKRHGEAEPEIEIILKHLILVSGLMLAATLVTPAGLDLWSLPFSTVARQAEQLLIAEWQSPDFHQGYLLPFAVLFVMLLAMIGGSKKKLQLYQLLLVSGFGLLGLYSVRNIFFFAIVAPAVLAPSIDAFLAEWGKKFRITNKLQMENQPTKVQSVLNYSLVIFFALIVVGRVFAYLPAENNWLEISRVFPVEAAAYLEEAQPAGNLLNSYNYGGYLIWALPEYPVFVDGRADLHQDAIIMEWYRTVNLIGDWQAVLKAREIGVALLEPEQPLVRELIEQGWQLGFQDELAVVLIKD